MAPGTCPTGMVAVKGNYCIDSTEVTWGQYRDWLANGPAPSAVQSQCEGKAFPGSFVPGGDPPTLDGGDDLKRPVAFVDWCDAYSFCKAQSKHLCGAIGSGAPVDYADINVCTVDQWYAACSSGGQRVLPYGDQQNDGFCNDGNSGILNTWDVPSGGDPSKELCHSSEDGYRGIYDMSGNVWEWEDSCRTQSGTVCVARGGSFNPEQDAPECTGFRELDMFETSLDYVGFRCCFDP